MKNQLTLEAFADWAEKQGDREYDYWDTRKCACSQFGDFIGMARLDSGFPTIWNTEFVRTANKLAAQHNNFSDLASLIRTHIAAYEA